MRIKILAVGRLKEAYLRDQAQELVRRIQKRHSIEIVEVRDLPDDDPARAVRAETAALLRHIDRSDHVLLLDLAGNPPGSFPELSPDRTNVIVIGGSNGVADSLRARADRRLRLSGFTFPHQLVRIIALDLISRR